MSCVCEARKPNNFSVGDQRQSFQATVRSLAGLNLHSLKNQRFRLPSRAPCRSDRSSKRAVIGTAERNRRILDRGVPRPVM